MASKREARNKCGESLDWLFNRKQNVRKAQLDFFHQQTKTQMYSIFSNLKQKGEFFLVSNHVMDSFKNIVILASYYI